MTKVVDEVKYFNAEPRGHRFESQLWRPFSMHHSFGYNNVFNWTEIISGTVACAVPNPANKRADIEEWLSYKTKLFGG